MRSAVLEKGIEDLLAKYDADQPRDENGRWTSTGSIADAEGTSYEVSYSDADNRQTYRVKSGETVVAEALMPVKGGYAEQTAGPYVGNVTVAADRRRKGVASALYSHIEGHQGVKLNPSPGYQTTSGQALWAARNRSAKVFKATHGKTPDDIAKAADLSAFDEIIAEVSTALGESAEAVSREVLARIGVDKGSDLVDVVNDRAVAMARDIGAEMVGMRWNADDELVPARRAAWRIDDTTRTMIRDTIADGLERNIGNRAIADEIEASTAFSSERAALIAHTEIARINSMASLQSYIGARDELDLDIKKEWLLGENPCAICQANAEQGAIDLDAEFQSGDDSPPAHPNCECAVSPVVGPTEPEDPDE